MHCSAIFHLLSRPPKTPKKTRLQAIGIGDYDTVDDGGPTYEPVDIPTADPWFGAFQDAAGYETAVESASSAFQSVDDGDPTYEPVGESQVFREAALGSDYETVT